MERLARGQACGRYELLVEVNIGTMPAQTCYSGGQVDLLDVELIVNTVHAMILVVADVEHGIFATSVPRCARH